MHLKTLHVGRKKLTFRHPISTKVLYCGRENKINVLLQELRSYLNFDIYLVYVHPLRVEISSFT